MSLRRGAQRLQNMFSADARNTTCPNRPIPELCRQVSACCSAGSGDDPAACQSNERIADESSGPSALRTDPAGAVARCPIAANGGREVARANPPATSNGGGHAERSAVRRDNDCICCREHGRVRQTGRNQEALSRRSRWNNRRARDDRPSVAPLSWQRARSHGRSGAGIRAIAFLKFGEVPLVRTGCPTGVGDRHSDGVRSAVCPLPLCNGCDQFGAVPR